MLGFGFGFVPELNQVTAFTSTNFITTKTTNSEVFSSRPKQNEFSFYSSSNMKPVTLPHFPHLATETKFAVTLPLTP